MNEKINKNIAVIVVSLVVIVGGAVAANAATTIGANIVTTGNTTLGDAPADTVTLSGATTLGASGITNGVSFTSISASALGLYTEDAGTTTHVGVDSQVRSQGTGGAGNVKAVQGWAFIEGAADVAEVWGIYGYAGLATTATSDNLYGVVGQISVASGTTIGVASGAPNMFVGLLGTSYADTGATLTDITDAAIIGQIAQGSNARKKATAAILAQLQGDNGNSNTAGAAFKVIDNNSTNPNDFDYGLDFGSGAGGPIGGPSGVTNNTFTQADIRLMNDETIDNKTNNVIKGSGVFIGKIGDVASASALGVGGYSVINLTGNTGVTSLTGGTAGQIVTIICNTDSVTFTDDDDALDITGDFVCGDDDVLQVVLDASSKWHEVGRATDS